MNKKKFNAADFLFQNKVVLIFLVLCVGATVASKQPLTFVIPELFTRIARNSFIVLSLIIPVIAGMGLNFGIVIGAMAAQIAIFLTTYWGMTGFGGFAATVALTTPIAVFFGYLVGRLFNYMKGNEMIGGLVLGYFADGLYQLLFLFIFGGVIKMNNSTLMIPTGIGVKNTIDLKDTVKYALDTVPMLTIVEVLFYVVLVLLVCSAVFKLAKKQAVKWKSLILKAAAAAAVYGLTFIGPVERFLSADRLLLLSDSGSVADIRTGKMEDPEHQGRKGRRAGNLFRTEGRRLCGPGGCRLWSDLCAHAVQCAYRRPSSGHDLSLYRSAVLF